MMDDNQQSGERNYPSYEDEVNLIDYLRILWKWKWLIIAGTFLCVIITAVISFQMPKIYEVSAVIEPGIIGFNKEGNFIYIDSSANISRKINEGVYNRRVQEALHLDPLKTRVEFKAEVGRGANTIKVTSQWKERDINPGVKATQRLLQLLSNDYRKIIEQRKGDYDKQIEIKLNSIGRIQNDIKLRRASLENIRQRKEQLLEEVKDVKENTEKIIRQRDALLKGKDPDNDLSFLLYSTTIQQNVAYLNQLNKQIYDLRVREKKIEAEVDRLNTDIDDIKTQINALNLEKEVISNIKVIQPPQVSLHPIKPRKKLNILISLVVGLFLMVFLAFFIEYIRKAR